MDKLEPIRAVFRSAGLYHHAADDLLCGELLAARINAGPHYFDGVNPPVPVAATPAAAVSAENVTPMRQPRADLARLVESINAAVYANGDGLSVTEAIGALELAKLELLKEQEQCPAPPSPRT